MRIRSATVRSQRCLDSTVTGVSGPLRTPEIADCGEATLEALRHWDVSSRVACHSASNPTFWLLISFSPESLLVFLRVLL